MNPEFLAQRIGDAVADIDALLIRLERLHEMIQDERLARQISDLYALSWQVEEALRRYDRELRGRAHAAARDVSPVPNV